VCGLTPCLPDPGGALAGGLSPGYPNNPAAIIRIAARTTVPCLRRNSALGMTLRPRHNPRLRDRDHEILEHVMRYRITTPEVLRQRFFPETDRTAVTKVTTRLCADEFLASYPLYERHIYFTLGRRGAKVCGLTPSKVGPLGPQSLYREFGTLLFCCRSTPERERIRFSQFQREFAPLVIGRLDASHYYVDRHQASDGKTIDRLGFIWVEGAGSVDHIVRTLRNDIIEPRRQVPEFRRRIEAGLFLIAVVTISEDKRAQIRQALSGLVTPVFFRVAAVPELIHLLPSLRNV